MNGLLHIAIAFARRVGFKVRRVFQPVAPFEAVLAHHTNDALATRRHLLAALRPAGDARGNRERARALSKDDEGGSAGDGLCRLAATPNGEPVTAKRWALGAADLDACQ